MKTQKINYMGLALMALLTVFYTSCKKSEVVDNPTPAPEVVTGVRLSTSTQFGNILTDNKGFALYFFANDVAGASACTGGCLTVWPVFYKENLTLGAGLNAADFSVVTRADGSKQSTFKGWPLYYYNQDTAAGDIKGDGVGGIWVVAKTDYTVMFGNAQLTGHDGLQYNDLGVAGTATSKFITDPTGRTLYDFKNDTRNTNTFTRADMSNNAVWPLMAVTGLASIPSVFDKTQFSTITVFGNTQLVYKGHPLYYFGQDASVRGNTKGVSFPTAGAGIWKVMNNATVAL
ncbi:hypothetical protein [Mucilaginibacter myungsuensis]|uniref:Secreted repeat protein with Y-X4-D motif n=1 Tax=Mucilaginibacter myungsuensis TaxID=649104 RepID=A0A929PWG3_9SPHI|nr:hypothetical protein [Mucilaginibacter myungsuensis]MBE9662104.1 hypothetical protein [Mucilaginibacter myungsuensis]MDN3599462.1 hypothetical protein [Mucilaginibacter myungsuensis]